MKFNHIITSLFALPVVKIHILDYSCVCDQIAEQLDLRSMATLK